MLRRHLLAGIAGLSAAAVLAACATTPANAPPGASPFASLVTDIDNIAAAFSAVAPQIGAVPGVPVTFATQVQSYAADLMAIGTQLASVDTQTQAQPLITRVSADVQAVIGSVPPAAIPSNVESVLEAAQVLIPVLEAAVGLATAGAPRTAMTPAQARAILRRAHS